MENGKYRVSVRCNLCGNGEDIVMELTREGMEAINLLGRTVARDSDWNMTILVCDVSGETPVLSGIPFAGSSGLTPLAEGCC
ncbi:hypothetical protein [Streptomyces sp. 5-10]|uniref:hypothetical protein n=1 Tax=Streptomyces sp. 5-10 TaxID=878925 RepID=UPI00168B4D41|nr:hypothetical protein [Streptomyces sp. 5-10]MBD3004666.1 hypothetical protein [Streptomyces sp. 5-10]